MSYCIFINLLYICVVAPILLLLPFLLYSLLIPLLIACLFQFLYSLHTQCSFVRHKKKNLIKYAYINAHWVNRWNFKDVNFVLNHVKSGRWTLETKKNVDFGIHSFFSTSCRYKETFNDHLWVSPGCPDMHFIELSSVNVSLMFKSCFFFSFNEVEY